MSPAVKWDYPGLVPTLTHDDSENAKSCAEACAGRGARHCPDCFYIHQNSFISQNNAMKSILGAG